MVFFLSARLWNVFSYTATYRNLPMFYMLVIFQNCAVRWCYSFKNIRVMKSDIPQEVIHWQNMICAFVRMQCGHVFIRGKWAVWGSCTLRGVCECVWEAWTWRSHLIKSSIKREIWVLLWTQPEEDGPRMLCVLMCVSCPVLSDHMLIVMNCELCCCFFLNLTCVMLIIRATQLL